MSKQTKPKIVYKVVHVKNEQYVSACVQVMAEDWQDFIVTYKLNEWTTPRIAKAPLFCFKTLEDAQYYKRTCSSFHQYAVLIFKCEALNVRKGPKIIVRGNKINGFWQLPAFNRNKYKGARKNTWETACVADAIKLIEQV